MTRNDAAGSLRACRAYRRRGNALVESALVLVPLLAVMLGIVDFSMAIFLRSTFQHACREGVRFAVTYQILEGMQHDASIRSVVQQNAMGFLSSESGAEKIKINYYTPDTFVLTSENAPGNIIEVSVEGFQWGWIVPLLRSGTPLQITARATDRMEGLAGGADPPER